MSDLFCKDSSDPGVQVSMWCPHFIGLRYAVIRRYLRIALRFCLPLYFVVYCTKAKGYGLFYSQPEIASVSGNLTGGVLFPLLYFHMVCVCTKMMLPQIKIGHRYQHQGSVAKYLHIPYPVRVDTDRRGGRALVIGEHRLCLPPTD